MSATTGGDLYFSLAQNSRDTTLPDVGDVSAADILKYDGSEFSFAFRGADVGLDSADIDAFAFLSDSELLLSFGSTVNLTDLGAVGRSDIVLFTADEQGDWSAGTFSQFFVGSQVGLSSSLTDNVIGVDVLDNGNLLISTAGEVVVSSEDGSTLSARREDILQFAPTSVGPVTAGTWDMYLDGSDVGLSFSTESVDGISIQSDGRLFLSTAGSFFADGFGGSREDVFEFIPEQIGEDSAGSILRPLFFNGNEIESTLVFENINAIEVRSVSEAPTNNPPTADSQETSTREDTSVSIQLGGDDGNPELDQTLTFSIVDGPAHGTIIGFNSETGKVVYIPDADYNGPDSFAFVVIDDATVGGEALTSEVATVSIEVTAVNDAPVNTVGGTQLLGDEDHPIVIWGISVHDVDVHEGNGRLEVTLSVQFGTLNVEPAAAPSATVEGNGSGQVKITGTAEEINAILASGLTYQGALNFSGEDSLRIVTSDLGNTGEGNVLSDTSQIGITVRSGAEQIQALDQVFEDLVETGELDKGPANSLQSKLKAGGSEKAQLGRLKAFTNQVKAMVKSGKLSADLGSLLTEAANTIRDSISIG